MMDHELGAALELPVTTVAPAVNDHSADGLGSAVGSEATCDHIGSLQESSGLPAPAPNHGGSSLQNGVGQDGDADTAWITRFLDDQAGAWQHAIDDTGATDLDWVGMLAGDIASSLDEPNYPALLAYMADDQQTADIDAESGMVPVASVTIALPVKIAAGVDEAARRKCYQELIASKKFYACLEAGLQADPTGRTAVTQPVTRSRLDVPQPPVSADLVKFVLRAEALRMNRPVVGSRLPDVLVCNGTGELSRALVEHLCCVTTVSDDPAVIHKGKAVPYGSPGAIERDLKARETHWDLYAAHPVQPGAIYRLAQTHATGLATSSFDLLIVEQAHRLDLPLVIAELQRLARPGAVVVLLGYQPFWVDKPKVTNCLGFYWNGLLGPLLTAGERALRARFADLTFPFSQVADVPGLPRKDPLLTAKWNCLEMVAHLDDWPVVQRAGLRTGTRWPEIGQMHTALRQAWGPLKARHILTWKIFSRVGVAG